MKPILLFFFWILCLSPLLAEIEPNDDCSLANPLQLGIVMTGNFDQSGDQDYYSFHVTQPGTYIFDLSSLDDSAKISCEIYHPNDCSKYYRFFSKTSSTKNLLAYYLICDTGIFFIKLNEPQHNINLSTYSLKIDQVVDDSLECNNSFNAARMILFDRLYAGYFLGSGELKYHNHNDPDYYKVYIPTKGIIKIDLPLVPHDPDLVVNVVLYDSLQRYIAQDCICGNTELVEYLQALICNPGTYYFQISNWNGSQSINPYNFIVHFIADSTECNDNYETAFHLENGQTISGYSGGINTSTAKHDEDWYSFYLDQPGVLNLNIFRSDTFTYQIGVYNSNKSPVFSVYYYYDGLNKYKNLALCQIGKYTIQLLDKTPESCGKTKNKFTPYQLQLNNVSADIYECNNTFSSATNISANDTLYASFASFNDTDLYKVYLNQYDTLVIYLDSFADNVGGKAEIFNNSKIKLQSTGLWQYGNKIHFINKQLPGYFYILLNNLSSVGSIQKYRMILENKTLVTESDDLKSLSEVKLSNLNNDFLYVDIKADVVISNSYFLILNPFGQLIQTPKPVPSDLKINITELPAGFYNLIFYTKNYQQINCKFVKI